MRSIFILVFIIVWFNAKSQTAGILSSDNIESRASFETQRMIATLQIDKRQYEGLLSINRQHLNSLAVMRGLKIETEERRRKVFLVDSVWKTNLIKSITKEQFQQYFENAESAKNTMKQKSDSLAAKKKGK